MDDRQEYESVFQMWRNYDMEQKYPIVHNLRFKITVGIEHTEYSKRGKKMGRSQSWSIEE